MVERLRAFVGVTELNYSKASVMLTSDQIVNSGKIDIEANANVQSASVIDLKQSDGSTGVFTAIVRNINKSIMWNLAILTNGYELMNRKVENVWENATPEEIVEDVVTNYTENLTFASSAVSGITLGKYKGNAYAIDIIKDMMDTLQWQLRIDVNDNVYFEPKGEVDTGFEYTNGSNCNILSWEEQQHDLFNHVKVIGGFASFSTEETIAGTGTTFALSHKPTGVMKAVVSGVEVDSEEYQVNAEDSEVVFDASKTNPTFFYGYDQPVIVENQDDISIATYLEIFKEIQAPWIDNFPDARKYSQSLLDEFSTPSAKVRLVEPQLNFDLSVGETVIVTDSVRNLSKTLVVSKLTYKGESGQTEVELGNREFLLYDWQREVQERVKKLERRTINEDKIYITRLIKAFLDSDLADATVFEYSSPTNTFILSHPTLNRLKESVNGSIYNFEADCTDNVHDGTWYGSSIDGAQFTVWSEGGGVYTPDFAVTRLSFGKFNGSDNYVDVGGSISGTRAIAMKIYPTANTDDIIKLTASDKISIDGSNDIITTGLAGVTIYVNEVATTAVTLNAWNDVVVVFDSITANDIEVGRSATYFTGRIDEFMVFSGVPNAADLTLFSTKAFYDIDNAYQFSATTEMHLAFDNPELGIRNTARVTVT